MPAMNGNKSRQLSPGAQSGMHVDQIAADKVKLSTQGEPSIDPRLAKIAILQRAIADGTYGVPAGSVAEKMVERLLHPSQAAPSDTKLGWPARKDAS